MVSTRDLAGMSDAIYDKKEFNGWEIYIRNEAASTIHKAICENNERFKF